MGVIVVLESENHLFLWLHLAGYWAAATGPHHKTPLQDSRWVNHPYCVGLAKPLGLLKHGPPAYAATRLVHHHPQPHVLQKPLQHRHR